jgi:hypothetical protein
MALILLLLLPTPLSTAAPLLITIVFILLSLLPTGSPLSACPESHCGGLREDFFFGAQVKKVSLGFFKPCHGDRAFIIFVDIYYIPLVSIESLLAVMASLALLVS